MMRVEAKFHGRTIACIATGPSLTLAQVKSAGRFIRFGCNNIWTLTQLDVLYGCNYQWWHHYWSRALMTYPADKWTANPQAAREFGVRLIDEKNAPGLSTDPDVIHHGHGGGYSQVNLAYLYGAARILLLGYDCKYAPDYDGRATQPGSTPRHYFGEYPPPLQHWPSVQVKAGVHVELLELYRSIARQDVVEIINCTPDSVIDCFPRADIDDVAMVAGSSVAG